MADYKLQHDLTMGAGQEMMRNTGKINDAVLKEMDRLAERDAEIYKGVPQPDILTRHVKEAINNVRRG